MKLIEQLKHAHDHLEKTAFVKVKVEGGYTAFCASCLAPAEEGHFDGCRRVAEIRSINKELLNERKRLRGAKK